MVVVMLKMARLSLLAVSLKYKEADDPRIIGLLFNQT